MRMPDRAQVDCAMTTLRDAWPNDGAEGESVHLVCDALLAERARADAAEATAKRLRERDNAMSLFAMDKVVEDLDAERLLDLAKSFPTLKDRLATAPREFGEIPGLFTMLHENASERGGPHYPAPGDVAMHAARFVLNVARVQAWGGAELFELFTAWCCWDEDHQKAWQAWAASPWWM